MFSYLALVYDATNPTQSQVARGLAQRTCMSSNDWLIAFDVPGLTVYYQDARLPSCGCHPLPDCGGVILGTLFDRGASSHIHAPVLSQQQGARIVASGGRDLINTHWGSYVAFLHDAHTDQKSVLRSPAGHLPCYRTVSRGVHLYFSRDYTDADPTPRSIDWSYVAAAMTMPRESENTGLRDVFKVQPGECQKHRGNRLIREQYWNPAQIAETDVLEDPDKAARELHDVTRNCVHAWAARHSGILLNLSGGLDSSIVLGCLRDAPSRPRIVCVNHYSPGHRSDERAFARLAAESAGCELIEWLRDSQIRLDDMQRISRFPEPQVYFRRVELSRLETRLARKYGATALFSGSGGDQLFCHGYARHVVADALHRRQFDHLFRAAYYASLLEGISIWRVMGRAFYEGLIPRPWKPLKEALTYRTLLAGEKIRTLQEGCAVIPLWLQSRPRVPPGKRLQILALTPRSYYDSLGEPTGPELIAPLMSQPVVEVCLRIPTYVAIKDGWYRAIARRAFVSVVPPEILKRRSKGGIEEHVLEIWKRNMSFAREVLLDGSLVSEGLLDRKKLEEALSDRPSGIMKGMADIFDYVCIETWIRTMTRAEPYKAA